jgi:hypothetical protein
MDNIIYKLYYSYYLDNTNINNKYKTNLILLNDIFNVYDYFSNYEIIDLVFTSYIFISFF